MVIINKTELMTHLSKCCTGAAPTCQADMINDSYIAQEEGYGFPSAKNILFNTKPSLSRCQAFYAKDDDALGCWLKKHRLDNNQL